MDEPCLKTWPVSDGFLGDLSDFSYKTLPEAQRTQGIASKTGCEFGHQVLGITLKVTCIATLPWIALLALSISIETVSSSARVTSVKFAEVAHSLS